MPSYFIFKVVLETNWQIPYNYFNNTNLLRKSIKLLIAIFLTVPFLITAKTEQLDKNITTKVDVKSFWNQLKRTRN